MTEAQIIAAVRRGIRETSVQKVTDDDITDQILVAVQMLGLKIEEVDPSFFHKRVSLSSGTYVFAWPTDCAKIIAVWDMDGTAGDITDASNTRPIVITEAAHGRSSGDIVVIHDVGGNTAANGTWPITYVNANQYSLDGSAGTAAYTSGGKVFAEPSNPTNLKKINVSDASGDIDTQWYPRGTNIVVDDHLFTDDLIIDYASVPDEISDIPAKFHFGIVNFCVWNLISIPEPSAVDYADKTNSYAVHMRQWEFCNRRIEETMRPSSEPTYVADLWGIENVSEYDT